MGTLFSDIGSAIGYASSGAERGRESKDAGDTLNDANALNSTVNADPTANAYGNVQLDPSYLSAASQALNTLGQTAQGSGLTAQEGSALQAAQLSNAQQQGAATQAALGNAARSGTLNSGRALAGTLGAAQGATNANAQAGAQAASQSAADRLNAASQVGQLGNALSNTQANQQFQVAQGTNQANQFNSAQNVQAQQMSNQDALAKEGAQADANNTLIGLNQQQAKGIQGVGSSVGDAVGQVADAAATGGLSSLANMFSGSGGGSTAYQNTSGPTLNTDDSASGQSSYLGSALGGYAPF